MPDGFICAEGRNGEIVCGLVAFDQGTDIVTVSRRDGRVVTAALQTADDPHHLALQLLFELARLPIPSDDLVAA